LVIDEIVITSGTLIAAEKVDFGGS